MRTSSLVARVKRLEAGRRRDYLVIELIADASKVTPEVRAAWLADARRRWPRGCTLEDVVIASFEIREAAPAAVLH